MTTLFANLSPQIFINIYISKTLKQDLPPIEYLEISVDEDCVLQPLGKVTSVIGVLGLILNLISHKNILQFVFLILVSLEPHFNYKC